jgi:hypothetical protein
MKAAGVQFMDGELRETARNAAIHSVNQYMLFSMHTLFAHLKITLAAASYLC